MVQNSLAIKFDKNLQADFMVLRLKNLGQFCDITKSVTLFHLSTSVTKI